MRRIIAWITCTLVWSQWLSIMATTSDNEKSLNDTSGPKQPSIPHSKTLSSLCKSCSMHKARLSVKTWVTAFYISPINDPDRTTPMIWLILRPWEDQIAFRKSFKNSQWFTTSSSIFLQWIMRLLSELTSATQTKSWFLNSTHGFPALLSNMMYGL